MNRSLAEIAEAAELAMREAGHGTIAQRVGQDCAWLEACGYPGLKTVVEALRDATQAATLTPDALGLDLKNVSCVFLADDVCTIRAERGRVYLRNVRHGLFLLPASVRENFGIGCPIDPGFAFGGERTKNPYVEKLALAEADGVSVDDSVWQSIKMRS